MSSLVSYGDSDEDEGEESSSPQVQLKPSMAITPAPFVAADMREGQQYIVDMTSQKSLSYNPKAEDMWRPVEGPLHPQRKNLGMREGLQQNTELGFVEADIGMDHYVFEEQYHNFKVKGEMRSATPGYASMTIKGQKLTNPKMADLLHLPPDPKPKEKEEAEKGKEGSAGTEKEEKHVPRWKQPTKGKQVKRKKTKIDDGDFVESWEGSWGAQYEGEKTMQEELTDEQKAVVAAQKAKKAKRQAEDRLEEGEEYGPNVEETSQFHGEELYDYQGRSFLHPPSELRATGEHKCYIPKKKVQTWMGHQGGVNKISWFPKTGHLLLSASMDSTIKIWSTEGQRKCLRTYMGHGQSVRDIVFSEDGTRFVSVSYDRFVKQWDTETGQVISRHTSAAIPYCINMNPKHQSQVLVGQANKLVVQWDLRDNNLMQKYNEHLGPVNSITFCDDDRRFISTSDDKKIFVWEYGLPVVIKHISEPELHSMPTMAKTPNDKYAIANSNDNRIVLFQNLRSVKMNRKKSFTGHLVSGYACQLGFSPDMKFVYSGDAQGRVFFWDFRTTRIMKVLKAHDQVCNGAIWHPVYPSKFATCSWDGTIKYWD